jgi:pimeloyl-ACP methyl ester carboxylesterase
MRFPKTNTSAMVRFTKEIVGLKKFKSKEVICMNFKEISLKAAGLLIGIIVLGILISLPFYFHDMSRLNKTLKERSKTIDSPYGTIEFVDIGEGKPVLISHGTMGGYDFGLLTAQGFLSGNYRLIIPSRFGYLQSSIPSDDSFEAQADSYAYLLDQLGIDKAVIAGTSAGGVPAIQFAIRHPERISSLILISTVAYSPPSEFKAQNLPIPGFVYDALLKNDYIFWAMLKVSPSTVHSIIGASDNLKNNCSKEELELMDKMGWALMPVSKRYQGWNKDAENINKLEEMSLDRIKAPTLIIGAEDDTFAPHAWSKYTAKNIHNSKLITVRFGGHMLLGHMHDMRRLSEEFIEKNFTSHGEGKMVIDNNKF